MKNMCGYVLKNSNCKFSMTTSKKKLILISFNKSILQDNYNQLKIKQFKRNQEINSLKAIKQATIYLIRLKEQSRVK